MGIWNVFQLPLNFIDQTLAFELLSNRFKMSCCASGEKRIEFTVVTEIFRDAQALKLLLNGDWFCAICSLKRLKERTIQRHS